MYRLDSKQRKNEPLKLPSFIVSTTAMRVETQVAQCANRKYTSHEWYDRSTWHQLVATLLFYFSSEITERQ